NQVFEYNTLGPGGTSTAKDNNSSSVTATVAVEPYADLATSNVTAPALTIGDPAQVTIGWTVTNMGTGPSNAASWVDAVIASPDRNPDHGKTLAEFTHTGVLNVGNKYTRTETISLPPHFQGRYHLFVKTNATGAVFENGSLANN